jgi:opacity protein-like surface antigen
MNKFKLLLVSLFLVLSITAAKAGSFGMGFTGSITDIQADGNEVDSNASSVKTTGSADNLAFVPSVFAEYTTDVLGITVGIDFIPLATDVSSKTKKRSDIETSVTDTATATNATRNQSAQAEISDHLVFYAELPVYGGFYISGGIGSVDVETKENLGTGSSYGDASPDIIKYGIGVKNETGNGWYYKAEYAYTDYDTIKLTSGTNTITADLDTSALRLSIGKTF